VHISAHWQQSAFPESVKTESLDLHGRAMTVDWLGDEAAREILIKAVRPVATHWGLDEQATAALVDVLVALSRHDYSGIEALREMLVQIEMNLDDELEGT
jgi:hypothetical protein